MTTLALLFPLALFGIDDAIIVLLIIIAAALISIALDLKKYIGDTRRAAAAAAQQKALTDLRALVTACQDAGAATAAECTELRRLLDVAVSAGVNQFVTNSIKTQIDKLCPGGG